MPLTALALDFFYFIPLTLIQDELSIKFENEGTVSLLTMYSNLTHDSDWRAEQWSQNSTGEQNVTH